MKLILMIVCSVLAFSQAKASGCSWTTMYTLGKELKTETVVGEFKCREYYGNFSCVFITQEQPARHFYYYNLNPHGLPPQNWPMPMQIQSFEAMQWDECDASQMPPKYEKNGTYDRFFLGGLEYFIFVADPVTNGIGL